MASTGLAWDRTLAVIDGDGVIQTQRIRRRLASIRTAIDTDKRRLTLAADGMPPIDVPLSGATEDGCTRIRVRQFGGPQLSGIPAWQYPSAASEWLTRYLADSPGMTIDGADKRYRNKNTVFHLARYDPTQKYERRVMDDIGGDNALPEDQVAFPDLYPLLVTARESLGDVNKRSSGPDAGMDRFRPNIVVAGGEAFDEDRWAVLEVGSSDRAMKLRCLENDPRCQIPAINQQTGEKDPNFEPAKTLRGFRYLFQFDFLGRAGRLAPEGPMFGIYATAGKGGGEVKVGDVVKVLEQSKEGESLHEYWSNRKPWQA